MSSVEVIQENTIAPKIHVIFQNSSDSSADTSIEESVPVQFSNKLLKETQLEKKVNVACDDICAKYISLSASSVFRHPYYNYPGIKDPGIKEALLFPEPRYIYPDDGQELYLAVCKEMNMCPIKRFYRGLLEEKINLKHYGINPIAFRCIAIALKNNNNVKILDLTDNWIGEDGCFHLGEMLIENITLQRLILHGCRIGPEGARKLFANLHVNQGIRELNLARNYLEDTGVDHLAKAIFLGSDVQNINLSYNKLTGNALSKLAEAFETHNKLTHLDVSWNTFITPSSVYSLCARLADNNGLEELNLSWTSITGPRVGKAMTFLLKNPTLKTLNLSNNKLSNDAIKPIARGILRSKSLITLDLSYNPLTPKDATILLLCMKERKVKLQKLLLDNVFVKKDFLDLRQKILSLKYRQNAVITWGGFIEKFKSKGKDMREIIFNRANAICNKSKKKVDIALVILELYKLNPEPMPVQEFNKELRKNGVYFEEGLLEEFTNIYIGPSTGKSKTINLAGMVDYMKRKWPERKLPPTPEPETDEKTKSQGQQTE